MGEEEILIDFYLCLYLSRKLWTLKISTKQFDRFLNFGVNSYAAALDYDRDFTLNFNDHVSLKFILLLYEDRYSSIKMFLGLYI